jgi:O-acetyl-ADP-ribose deacetylase (regulator of RNase III)
MILKIENTCLVDKLLNGDLEAIGHCCNCFNTMKSGVAKSVSELIPEAVKADLATTRGDSDKLGDCSIANKDGKLVFNLYGQYNYGYNGKLYLDYTALGAALEKMRGYCLETGIKKIGLPYKIGSDRAGGDWEKVLDIIMEVWYNTDIEVTLCRKK